MDDRSTISWWMQTRSRGRIARLVAILDRWTTRPAAALTADYCTVDGCAAA